MPLKTRYTVIEPGAVAVESLEENLTWHDIYFRAARPKYHEIDAAIRPLFNGLGWERVAVNTHAGPSDLFICIATTPVQNPLATAVYWTAAQMHRVGYGVGPDDYAEVHRRGWRFACRELKTNRTSRWVHGRAILMERGIWS